MTPRELTASLEEVRDEYLDLISANRRLEERIEYLEYVIARAAGYMDRGSNALAKQELRKK